MSFDEVKAIKEEFQVEYFKCPPVNSCGISNLKCQRDLLNQKFDLQPDESLEDLCISVGFESEPPKDMIFPSEYKGVRVFYRVQGVIQAF